jgi:hypothetical protein
MNNIFPILLGIFCCFSASAQAPEVIKLKKDVIDYYWEMSCVDKHLVSYPLEIKANKWTTVSKGDYEMEADVNTSKGYVFIRDPARDTLDNTCSFQFMLFEKSNGEPIVGISKKVFNGEYWEAEISFWKKNGGKWFKVNDEVMTELTYRDFLEGGNDGFLYDEHISKMMPLHYELPHKGNTIKINLLDEYFKIYCISIKPDDPGCGIQGSFKDEHLELHWNKSKGKFILSGAN